QPGPHAGGALVGERRRSDDRHRAVPRFGERAAAGPVLRTLGAGGPALSRAAPPASFDALSLAGGGAPPSGRAVRFGIDLFQGELSRPDAAAGTSGEEHDAGPLRAASQANKKGPAFANAGPFFVALRWNGAALFLGSDQHRLTDQREQHEG